MVNVWFTNVVIERESYTVDKNLYKEIYDDEIHANNISSSDFSTDVNQLLSGMIAPRC